MGGLFAKLTGSISCLPEQKRLIKTSVAILLFVHMTKNDGGYAYYVGCDNEDDSKYYVEVCRNGQTLTKEVAKTIIMQTK